MTERTRVVNKHVDYFYDVYIGRPSVWGNPFKRGVDGTRKEVIERYEAWIRQQPELLARLGELRGKVLACHCKPKACHGDVLVKLVEEAFPDDPRLAL